MDLKIDPLKIAEAGQADSAQGQQPTGQHAGGRTLNGHPSPPDTHEEQRKTAGRRDGKGLPNHEVDLKRLHLHANKIETTPIRMAQ